MFKQTSFISILIVLSGCEKNIQGVVLDCTTNAPVEDAVVSTNQTGWGISNGQVVWDKSYRTFATTDKFGKFNITFKVDSSAKLHVMKDGYYSAEQFEHPGKHVKIGMLSGEGDIGLEFTRNCKPLSECIVCTEHDDVTVCRDICFD